MAYKLIALDLDDTLLNAKKEVTPRTRAAIRKAAQAGVHVVLASGRPERGMKFVWDDIGLSGYTISSGGAVVLDPKGNEIFTCPVPDEAAKKIIRYAAQNSVYFQVYCGGDFYYPEWTENTAKYEASIKFKGIHDPGIPEWKDLKTSKILMIGTQRMAEDLRVRINRLFPEVQTVFSQNGYLEILNAGVSKGKALGFITQSLGLTPGEIIVIGDSEIDIPMIEFAGLGIAMQNAGEAVRKKAGFVTSSCEEDGVALAINKFVLGEDI
jgi:Cof subfamily protein (haloacid dehalogenase superfamily)